MPTDPDLAALDDPDYRVRLRGVYSLMPPSDMKGRFTDGNPLFVAPLLDLAGDPTKNVRNAIVWPIGVIASTERGRDGKMILLAALRSPEWRVRFAAARAYTWLRDEP
ncbi:MAG: hypothetical protein QOG85_2360, partial [Gaiellaceae bacterium]|nr:hypothetical protein [Gaiellaceae bacterium]